MPCWLPGWAGWAPRTPAPSSHTSPPPPHPQVGDAEKELGGASGTNPFAALVDEAEGLDKIEDLQVGVDWGQWVGWGGGQGWPGGQPAAPARRLWPRTRSSPLQLARSPPRPLATRPPTHPPHAQQNHSNEDIYEKAVAILEAYFDVEDGEEENLAPAVAEGGTYAFGSGPQGFGAAAPAGGFSFQ